jgi:hypothetical protein
VTDAGQLAAVYQYAVVDARIRPQDLVLLFEGSACTVAGTRFGWAFFRGHHGQLAKLFGSPSATLFQRCFEHATEGLCTPEAADDVEVRHFLEGKKFVKNLKILQTRKYSQK